MKLTLEKVPWVHLIFPNGPAQSAQTATPIPAGSSIKGFVKSLEDCVDLWAKWDDTSQPGGAILTAKLNSNAPIPETVKAIAAQLQDSVDAELTVGVMNVDTGIIAASNMYENLFHIDLMQCRNFTEGTDARNVDALTAHMSPAYAAIFTQVYENCKYGDLWGPSMAKEMEKTAVRQIAKIINQDPAFVVFTDGSVG